MTRKTGSQFAGILEITSHTKALKGSEVTTGTPANRTNETNQLLSSDLFHSQNSLAAPLLTQRSVDLFLPSSPPQKATLIYRAMLSKFPDTKKAASKGGLRVH